jgi:hypothetical protein
MEPEVSSRHCTLYWAGLILSSTVHCNIHLRLGLPICLLLRGLPIEILYAFIISIIHATWLAWPILLDSITPAVGRLGEAYNCRSHYVNFLHSAATFSFPSSLPHSAAPERETRYMSAFQVFSSPFYFHRHPQSLLPSERKTKFNTHTKAKDKAIPLHATETLEGKGGIAPTHSALNGGEWSASRPGRALAPAKGPPVPIEQEAGWAPEPVWTQKLQEKFFHLCRGSNLDRPVVQPVARHYTDWANRLTLLPI